MDKKSLNFIIPDFVNMVESIYLLDAFKDHNEVFKDNVKIRGLSGQFNGCSWNKKNKSDIYKLDIDVLKIMKQKYNDKYKVSLFIFFNKEDVSNKDLEDEYCNDLMRIFDNNNNYVICKSVKLSNYIKEKYRNITVITEEESSIYNIKLISDINLNKLNDEQKKKMIIITDGDQIPNKKFMFKHTKKDSILNKLNPKDDKYYTNKNNLSFCQMKKNKNYLEYDEIIKLANNGINNFLLSGFGMYNFAMIENIVSYLIKEEYRMDSRICMSTYIFNEVSKECNAIFNYRI